MIVKWMKSQFKRMIRVLKMTCKHLNEFKEKTNFKKFLESNENENTTYQNL
jgi:hypothetical protein